MKEFDRINEQNRVSGTHKQNQRNFSANSGDIVYHSKLL